MNKLTITGFVGKSDLRYTDKGTAVLKFSMAVERAYQKKGQDKVTDWFQCTLWGKYGEAMAEYIKKGAKVLVIGEMQIDYDKEKKKMWTNVKVDDVEIMKYADDKSNDKKVDDYFDGEEENDLESDDIPF